MRTILAALLFTLGSIQPAHAATIGEHVPSGSTGGIYGANDTFFAGQVFTANLSATVATAGLMLMEDVVAVGQQPSGFQIQLWSTSSGLPDVLLGSAAVANPGLTATPLLLLGDFSGQGLALTAGAAYALIVAPDDCPPATGRCFSVYGQFSDGYAGGNLIQTSNGGSSWGAVSSRDAGFRVSSVPEPSTALLVTMGLVALGHRRRSPGRRVPPSGVGGDARR